MNTFCKISTVLFVLTSCKPHVRSQEEFKPSIATKDKNSEKLVARQVVLITNGNDNEIENRLKNDPELEEKMHEILVTRGGKHPIIDKIRGFFSIPHKLILWNRTVGSGELHEDAETAVKLALEDGGSGDTSISINEYNPKLIWKRTFQNDKTSFLTKVTLGTLVAITYTVVPGRLLYMPSDHYNPYADTIVLYSNNLDIALHEAGHAIDFTEKSEKGIGPGLYGLGRFLFPITLYQEAVATGKAFNFLGDHGTAGDVASSYAILFPAFGSYLAAAILASNKLIDNIKHMQGREATKLTKWIDKKSAAIADWKVFQKTGTEATDVASSAKLQSMISPKVAKFAIIIPVIVGAHIVGRVMGAFVKTPYEKPVNPKLK